MQTNTDGTKRNVKSHRKFVNHLKLIYVFIYSPETKYKTRKTIDLQKKEILEREKNALLRCQLDKTIPILNNITQSRKYGNGKSISVGSLQMDKANKPKNASQSPSIIFPNVPSPNLVTLF